MIEKCPVCGKEFKVIASMRYCSSECRKIARSERNKKESHSNCVQCGFLITSKSRSDQKYCSGKCRDKAKNERKFVKLTERNCLACGKVFMPTVNKQVCCSKECSFKHHYLMNIDKKKEYAKQYRINNIDLIRIKDREKRERNKEGYSEYDRKRHDIKRFSGNRELVMDRDGHRCVMCGAKSNLTVHHKDHTGQTENRNDDPNNLITLCASCHGKQHGKPINPEIHIIVVCGVCGKEFNTTTYRVEDGRGKYCSAECRNKKKEKTNTVTLNCEYCGKEFTVPLSRYKRGKVKYDSMECRRAAGYAWTNKQSTN